MEISFINIIQIACIVFGAGLTIGSLRQRISKLENDQNSKYDELKNIITSRIMRVCKRLDKMENKIYNIETNITKHDELLNLHSKNISEIQKENDTDVQ